MSESKLTAAEIGALGGKARAEAMTPEERSEQARRAVDARWNPGKDKEAIMAPHNGVIRIGELEIPCSVLEDGTRVLSERGVLKAIGVGRSGYAHNRAKEDAESGVEGGAGLPLFVAPINLKPFIEPELASVLQKPIWYRPAAENGVGILHKGMRADMLPKVCGVWLKARDAGVLRGKRQVIAAANADILSRGLAEVGITALVDEATGFQDARARDALAKILERFIAKELQPYLSAFPLDFFRELCRLKGIPFPKNMRLPPYFGKLVNNLVYRRLAPGVLGEIQRVNPIVENGRRKSKNYKWLTPTVGHVKLLQLLGSEVTLMKMSDNYQDFEKLVDRFHEIHQDYPLLDWAKLSDREDQ